MCNFEKWTSVLNPDDAWGPALAIHRAEHFPLQIPEARRLLLPPEVEVAATPAPVCFRFFFVYFKILIDVLFTESYKEIHTKNNILF